MTTYRERRLARAERLREWGDGREAKSDAAYASTKAIADTIPFGQPILVGHHSEKRARRDVERMHSGMNASVEHARTADRHREKAANIEAQVAGAIYDDDADALERLQEKLAALEARREQMKAANAAFRKEYRELLKGKTAYERSCAVPHASYELSNLGGVISNTRKRIELLSRGATKAQRDRVITARYGGSCADCGAAIERGQQIRYSRASGARCEQCEEVA